MIRFGYTPLRMERPWGCRGQYAPHWNLDRGLLSYPAISSRDHRSGRRNDRSDERGALHARAGCGRASERTRHRRRMAFESDSA